MLPVTRYLPATYEVGKIIGIRPLKDLQLLEFNPISPFQNACEYKVARFFHKSKTSLTNIDQFFKENLLPEDCSRTQEVCFKSGHTWRKKMRTMVDQPYWQKSTVDFHL